MKTYVIEDLSDDDLLSLLISEAHECSVPSESNTLASIREELKLRLTKRAADGLTAWGNLGNCTICGLAWRDCGCLAHR